MAQRLVRAAAFPLAIFALNAYFARNLFTLEYSRHMGSIEAAYIAISRYMIANWRDLTWFPLWYGGIPFQNTYPPLLHASVATAATIFGLTPAHAYHLITAIFYSLGPVTLYWFALHLTRSRWYSFWAAWIYSIVSPSLILMSSVRADLGAWIGLRRYQALLPYGEGPHITALALIPVALLALDRALAKRSPRWYAVAAFAFASVALTNWLGTLALAIGSFALLVARTNVRSDWRAWVIALGIGALAYGLACSWIPPSTIQDIRYNARLIGGDFGAAYRALPLYAAAAIALIGAIKYAMHRLRVGPAGQFLALFAILMSAIPLFAEWFRIAIVPQPQRYHLEMDAALSLAIVFGARALVERLPSRYALALGAGVLAVTIFPARLDRRYARELTQPIDVAQTIEYRTARWFDEHMDGGRVMAAGSVSYWLNAFTDTPQLGGGFDQGIVNRTNAAVTYQILSADGAGDRAADIAAIWLRAYGVQAIAVSGPNTRQAYKVFAHPEAFARGFSEAAREGDDAIYWVPGRSASLAHVVARDRLVHDRPIHGLDIGQTQAYVAALGDAEPPPASFHWTSRHSAVIQAQLQPEQVISVQITYHPGWHASVHGTPAGLTADGLGQMVVEPDCRGACDVRLDYNGGAEMTIARVVSWLSVALCIAATILTGRKAQHL